MEGGLQEKHIKTKTSENLWAWFQSERPISDISMYGWELN